MAELFLQLDFLYTPSSDVAGDARYFTEVLGGRLVFSIEGMGARVAMVELAEGPPHVLLTDHLEGERPIMVYRVEDLDRTLAELESRGWARERSFEIPHGPCCSFRTPGGTGWRCTSRPVPRRPATSRAGSTSDPFVHLHEGDGAPGAEHCSDESHARRPARPRPARRCFGARRSGGHPAVHPRAGRTV